MVTNLNVQSAADTISAVSNAVMDHAQRIESLGEDMRKMKFNNDDCFKRLVFLGFPKMSFEERGLLPDLAKDCASRSHPH